MYCLLFLSYVQTYSKLFVRVCSHFVRWKSWLYYLPSQEQNSARTSILFYFYFYLGQTMDLEFPTNNHFWMRTIIVTWWKKVNKHRERNMNERRRIYRYIVPIYYSYWKVCSYVMVYLISVISNSSIPRY